MKTKTVLLGILVSALFVTACTKKEEAAAPASAPAADAAGSKGIGPVTELKLEPTVDAALATKGKAVFEAKCTACHKLDQKYVGPALGGVTKRRTPEWIMNMILNPAEMTQKDETAKNLLGEFLTQMTFQNVTQEETRGLLEYFRQTDAGK